MNLAQFTGFCYDEVAAKMGFIRFKNGYYFIGDRTLAIFALEKCNGGREIRPLMKVLPLFGEIYIGEDNWMMNQPESAFWRHISGRYYELNFSTKTPKEDCERIKEYLLDVFRETEEPFLSRVKDLKTGIEAYSAFYDYYKEGTPEPKNIFNSDINYWGFLLALKEYDKALDNFNMFARFIMKTDHALFSEKSLEGKLQRLLIAQEYDMIETIVKEREMKNLELLQGIGVVGVSRLTIKSQDQNR